MSPIYGCPEKIRSPWLRPWLLFPKLLMGFCCDRSYKSVYKILKLVALPVPEIIGDSLKLWASTARIRPRRSLFSKICHGILLGWTLLLFWENLKFVALPVAEIIAFGLLGGVQTPNLGEGEAVGGRGWYRSKERR